MYPSLACKSLARCGLTSALCSYPGRASPYAQLGHVHDELRYSGMQTEDLCAKTACPVMPGPITVTLVEALPPIAPPVRALAWRCMPVEAVTWFSQLPTSPAIKDP